MQPGETLVLIDGSSLAFRSFFALLTSGLRRRDGFPTWAIYGFFNSLFDLIERKKPDGIAVCFDLQKPTFRHEKFEDYKANRSEMPDDLRVQWPHIKEGVKLLGIPVYEVEGYEADDVIGTVSRIAQKKGIKIQILTGDQDTFQLVEDEGDAIQVLVPQPRQHELLIYGRQAVFDKLGVWPEQVVDYKGLCGDNSDNIPGVRGIGPKTAVQLLTAYQTLEGVYEHLEEIKSASVKKKLEDGRENAFKSKDLATMRFDAPLEFDFEHCQLVVPSMQQVTDFFTDMQFKTMVTRLPKLLSRFSESGEAEISVTVAEEGAAAASASGATASAAATKSSGMGGKSWSKEDANAAAAASSAVLVKPRALSCGPPEPIVVTSEEQLGELVAELSKQSAFALELETAGASSLESEIQGYAFAWANGLTWDKRLTSIANEEVKTAYVPVRTEGALGALDQLPADTIVAHIGAVLEDPNIGKIVHDCKSKMNALALVGIELGPIAFDPMLASYIFNPVDKHGLKEQAERLLGYLSVRTSEQSVSGKKQLTLNFSSVDKVASCAADDARITLELARLYVEQLDKEQEYLLYEMDIPLAGVLARMEQAGISLDLPYLQDLSQELTREISRLEKEIYEIAGYTFNIGSTQQLQKLLFEDLQLKTKARTKTGFSTDANVLEGLRNEHPVIGKILEYRQLTKLRSTYVDALPKEVSARDHRLHGEFNQASTSTGRLSSSNPNLQNIPIKTEMGRRIRRAFIPGNSGCVLLSADYSQIELRLLGHMCEDEILIDAFEKDQDIHARTSAEIFDVPVDQVTSEQRRIGKTLNFALIYQQGAFATAQDLGISTREAQTFIDKYFARYPKVRGFLNKTIEDARQNSYVKTIYGRKRHFRFLNDRSDAIRKADERAACNAPIQGSAADLMKLAMINLDKELKERGLQSKLILQVHDELVLEVPEKEVDAARQAVCQAMLMGQPLKVKLKIEMGVGKNWMDAK
jgi:DNA polymerase-1